MVCWLVTEILKRLLIDRGCFLTPPPILKENPAAAVRIGQLQDRATGPDLVRNSATSTSEVLNIFGRDFIRDGFYFRGRGQTVDPDYIIPSPFPPSTARILDARGYKSKFGRVGY